MPASDFIQGVFSRISNRYDWANRVLSLGCDHYWRYKMVAYLKRHHPKKVLDVATGSGDVAFALLKGLMGIKKIIAIDFCESMLNQAKIKQLQKDPHQLIDFQWVDLFKLEGLNASFDAITVAFGVRNFENRLNGLKKMYELLRPGGHLIILEASQPYDWVKPLYTIYLKKIMPMIAGWISGDRPAYDYLASSISEFPNCEAMKNELLGIGFCSVGIERFMLGSVAIHVCIKKKDCQ